MIIEDKRNNYLKRLPFSASFDKEKMIVTFYEGYIFNCFNYNKNSSQSYKNGSYFKKTRNNSEKFSVSIGDQFFVSTEGLIYKVSKTQRESGFSHSGVMIWEAPTEEKGEGQGLSENLFIQDYEENRQKGFQISLIKQDEQKDYYRINSGFVFAPQLGYSRFIQGFEFSKPKGEDVPTYRLRVNVRATLSAMNPVGDSGMNFINGYEITNCTLEEGSEVEDEVIKLSQFGYFLDGIYYCDLEGEGNIHLFFNLEDNYGEVIEAGSYFEVRGVKYYKNGVFFNPSIDDDYYSNRGYYKEILKTTTSQKYTNPGLVPSGTHTKTERYYVEGDDLLPTSSNGPETLYEEVSNPPLAPNEILGEEEITYEFTGISGSEEISPSLYAEARSEVESMEWVDFAAWVGDGTPVLQGAGKEGETTVDYPYVTHAERRFKKAGIPTAVFTNMPENYIWYGGILYLGESEVALQESLSFKRAQSIYTNDLFVEIEFSTTEGVYGKEYIDNECEAQAKGGYSTIYISKYSDSPYQELTMTSSSNTIV